MKKQFDIVEKRALAAHLTINELLALAGVNQVTYWRAKNGRHKRPATAMLVLRKVRERIATVEAERARAST